MSEENTGFDVPGTDWPDDGTLELYALDALDDVQRARVDRAIAAADPAAADAMRARIRDAREVAADLVAEAGADVAPPPELRATILDAVDARRAGGAAAPGTAEAAGATDAGTGGRPARQRPRWMPAAAAAAVVLLAGGVLVGTALRGGLGGPPPPQDAPVPTTPTSGMYEQIMAAPDMSGDSVDMGSHGTAELVSSRSMDMGVATFTGMPAASEGMRYQLWLVEPAGGHVALPALQTRADGTMVSEFSGLRDSREVMLTEEPMAAAASPAPTGDMLVSLTLR